MRINGARVTLLAASAAALTLGLSACDVPFVTQTPSVEQAKVQQTESLSAKVDSSSLVEDGCLTVGLRTSRTTAPFCITGDDDAVMGMDVDVASALADQLGLKVKFVQVTSASKSLGQTCDIVMDMSDSSDGDVKVVGSYAESTTAFFRKGNDGVVKVDDLSSKVVGIQGGSVSQKALQDTGLVVQEKTFDNLNKAFDALAAGNVDYVLCDAYSGAYLSAHFNGISFCGTLDEPVVQGVAVSSSNESLQSAVSEALSAIQSNGQVDVIRCRWVGGMTTITSDQQIKDIPAKQQEEAQPADATDADNPGDGSTAGSNAAII